MQDARPGLRGTIVTGLPVISTFSTRASKGISREGTSFLPASRDTEDLLKTNKVCRAQVIFTSRGADLGVNRWGK